MLWVLAKLRRDLPLITPSEAPAEPQNGETAGAVAASSEAGLAMLASHLLVGVGMGTANFSGAMRSLSLSLHLKKKKKNLRAWI